MMARTQVVIEEELLERAKQHARRSGESLSAVVRRALSAYLASTEPDDTWMGSLRPRRGKSHRWADVQRSITLGMSGKKAP